MIIDESNIHYKEKQAVIGITDIHSCFRFRGTGEECQTCSIVVLKKENATCEILLNYLEGKWKSRQIATGVFFEIVKLTIDAVKERIKDAKITFKTPALFMGYIKSIFLKKLITIQKESGSFKNKDIIIYFHRDDFNGESDEKIAGVIEILYKEIIKDFPDFNNFSQTGCKLKVLHNILESPNFYDDWKKKFPNVSLVPKTELLLSETAQYRKSDQPFSQLKKWQKNKILTLNRLLLEQVYGIYCPKMQNFEIINFDCEAPDYRGKNPNALSDNEIDGINAENLWSILDENIRQGKIKDSACFLKDEYRLQLPSYQFDYSGMTDEELARCFGVSEKVVRKRRSRALKEIYKNPAVRKCLENLLDTPKLTEKIGHVFPEGRVKEKDIRGWCYIAVDSATSGIITVLLKNEDIPQGIKITNGMVLHNLKVKKIIKNKLYVELCNELK